MKSRNPNVEAPNKSEYQIQKSASNVEQRQFKALRSRRAHLSICKGYPLICEALAANNFEYRGREAARPCVRVDWSELHRSERGDWKEGLRNEDQNLPSRSKRERVLASSD